MILYIGPGLSVATIIIVVIVLIIVIASLLVVIWRPVKRLWNKIVNLLNGK